MRYFTTVLYFFHNIIDFSLKLTDRVQKEILDITQFKINCIYLIKYLCTELLCWIFNRNLHELVQRSVVLSRFAFIL